MANITTVTKLLDGDRHAIFHIYVQGDGITGDMTDFVLVDPAMDVTPVLSNIPSFTIEKLWYDLSGFDARLEFEFLVDGTNAWVLSGGNGVHMDFSEVGGLKDRSSILDGTGKLMLTTSGLLSANDTGTIIVKLRKD